jgi:hypothetical protein
MSILYAALREHDIPFPKEEVTFIKFTRWGKMHDIGRENF